jgi:DNA cross-link repair 1A protein
MATRGSSKPLTPRANSKSNVPAAVKQSTKKTAFAKTPGKPNSSILSFFKKVDSPAKDNPLFLPEKSQTDKSQSVIASPSAELLDNGLDELYGDEDSTRFNEVAGSVKRRKTSSGSLRSDSDEKDTLVADAGAEVSNGITLAEHACSPPPPEPTKTKEPAKTKPKKPRRRGPFLSDSDTDDDMDDHVTQKVAVKAEKEELDTVVSSQPDEMNGVVETEPINQNQIHEDKPIVPSLESVTPAEKGAWKRRKKVPIGEAQAKWEALQPNKTDSSDSDEPIQSPHVKVGKEANAVPAIPALKKEETSVDDWSRFDDIGEFPDDEFADGEEFVERKWMEEQARLEAAEEAENAGYKDVFNGFDDDLLEEKPSDEGMTPACPICSANLGGITPDQATRHVNGCLDGNPIPLPPPVEAPTKAPAKDPVKTEPSEVKHMPLGAHNRFARKAAIARPGQANPFDLGDSSSGPSTAFSKLMSGKAEDAAWASAAAAEQASRGKPAYQRTCPFYKIMPGFFICVDAFRYGAVQGCNAYFLSHFHSDHYVGLTSSWCHGPIYCSKVTANLVKQQLRVDPKYVVALEFEERFEVPGTQGVAVSMIPANHCPGSSLFLFEKIIGKGTNPKVQRVLHCGDFRACPAHIAHPLLMPGIIDSITGKTKQQKIDVCYLDTTYLNPRYAFPSQEEVIKACADMCVSLKKERAEENDAWETVKRERAGAGMAKFVTNGSSAVKAEDNSVAMSLSTKNAKPRGRLLVVCGTYSIGKERICMGIARALDCKIWAPPGKMRICAALEDEELMSRMTDDPREAQIHMQMLMEIRPETLQEYLKSYTPHFSRVVGFRPSGWNYRPPNSRYISQYLRVV